MLRWLATGIIALLLLLTVMLPGTNIGRRGTEEPGCHDERSQAEFLHVPHERSPTRGTKDTAQEHSGLRRFGLMSLNTIAPERRQQLLCVNSRSHPG